MIVVDTNIIAYLYISGERSQQAEQILSIDANWNAPVLWRSEFRNVLSRYLHRGTLSLDETLLIIRQAEELLSNKEYQISSAHIMRLVHSSNCSSYDCEFVALAQYLSVSLITADKKILRQFPGIAKSPENHLA